VIIDGEATTVAVAVAGRVHVGSTGSGGPYVGARRLEHLRYLGGDPLVTRFCGLARLPTRRTVADWLRQFTQETLAPLVALNRDLVTEALARLELPRLTIDVDGSSTLASSSLQDRACGRRMATDLASDQPPTRCLLRAGLSQAHVWSPGDSDTLLAKDRRACGP
jgi:hypothetical protein